MKNLLVFLALSTSPAMAADRLLLECDAGLSTDLVSVRFFQSPDKTCYRMEEFDGRALGESQEKHPVNGVEFRARVLSLRPAVRHFAERKVFYDRETFSWIFTEGASVYVAMGCKGPLRDPESRQALRINCEEKR